MLLQEAEEEWWELHCGRKKKNNIISILEEDIPSKKALSHGAYTQIWESLLYWDCHRLMVPFW